MIGTSADVATSAASGHLHVELDAPLPQELWFENATALFVCGWCFHPRARIAALSVELDAIRHPVIAHGMPRLDPFRQLHPGLDPDAREDPDSAEDPGLRSYASGFWGLVAIDRRASGEPPLELGLHAELEDGGHADAPLGSIAVAGAPAPTATILHEVAEQAGPLVAICMATHNPPPHLLTRQLESIRAQTHRRWICLISDDCSRPERFAQLEAEIAGDTRFVLSRSPYRLDFYRNFERALAMVPREVRYVALADQDDYWHPDKLATLIDAIRSAALVYSDARVVTGDGKLISETYWNRRRNNYTDLLSLLVANSVTGAASLFRRELLDDALPFPPAQFAHYHDHWLGLVARTLGEIAFVDRPLYDYVQHGTATLGHAAANRMPTIRDRLGAVRSGRRERVRMWRMHYFVDACRLLQLVAILDQRAAGRISRGHRRVLKRFREADRSLIGLGELWVRGVRELLGRRETLGAEWMLFRAFAWRRMLSATARERPQRRLRLDAVPPADLAPRPGRRAAHTPAVRSIAAKIAPLELARSEQAPTRLNLLIPTIDLTHLFGGYIAKYNLARRLAQFGARVRIVTVDEVPPLPRDWRGEIEAYSELSGLFDQVEVAFGRGGGALEVSPADRFIATTWWTAHIASDAGRMLGAERFLYMIQEYEPFTFPMGTYAALAAESYRFPHYALFSTELLRGYFRRHRIGVYAGGAAGEGNSWAFQNAITDVPPPAVADLRRRVTRKLLFYARPEPHAARNLFELGTLALGRALEQGAFADGWALNGIGTVELPRQLPLGRGTALNLLSRVDQSSYAQLLREHDVGLALMYTPHPSLVPIEMASAGMVTVTNSFQNKTASAMTEISANLMTAEPSIEAIADALCSAAVGADDFEGRVRASDVRWSRSWGTSFPDALVRALLSALESR